MPLPNPEDLKKYAVICCYYKDKCYVSLPMLLEDNSEFTITIKRISEFGTGDLIAWKMPISENSFLLFSRLQLDETLFEIGTYSGSELRELSLLNSEVIQNKKPIKKKIQRKK